MKHSPLPWKRCSANEGKCSCGLIWSVPADCTVASAHSVKDEFDEGPTLEQSHVNADFIVRAVNSHEELLEACKDTERDLSDLSGLLADEHAVVLNVLRDRLEAAIAKATTTLADQVEIALDPLTYVTRNAKENHDGKA